jgi:hypothetical protein
VQSAEILVAAVQANNYPKRPRFFVWNCLMVLRHRPMLSKDVRECAEIVAAHPIIGPRYGPAIQDLRSAWLRLLQWDAKRSSVLEKADGYRKRICFVGVSVFVTDDFVREMKTPPLCWFGPELAKRIVRGNSPVLSDQQLAEANTLAGLNLLVWEGCFHTALGEDPEIPRTVMDVFIEDHRGFRLKELLSSQIESAERLQWTLGSGSLLWDPVRGRYLESANDEPRSIVQTPHLLGVTRDIECARRPWNASWVGALFDYQPPRCGFSRREQRLLTCALGGDSATDEQLAAALGVSIPTIKKMWSSVYGRVADHKPEIMPVSSRHETGKSERGKEKRRRLLTYLREHPEELRPVSRRLLAQQTLS